MRFLWTADRLDNSEGFREGSPDAACGHCGAPRRAAAAASWLAYKTAAHGAAMSAFAHKHRPPQFVSIKRALRSDDSIRTRAARIVDFMALSGDGALIDRHIDSVAEILGDYAALDKATATRK